MTTYLQLAGLFASLSLLSIGGGNAVLPEMHLQAVKGHHWMTDSQFADIFSISQTAPGPSILIVTLVGYGAGLTVGGIPGAIVGGLIHRRDDPARGVVDVRRHAALAEGAEIEVANRRREGVRPADGGPDHGDVAGDEPRRRSRLAGVSADSDMHGDLHLHQDEPAGRGRRRRGDRVLRRGLRRPREAVDLIHC